MSAAAFPESVFSLPVAERISLADRLYASVPDEWQQSADRAWLSEAERRAAEMDDDSSMELSQEEFFAGLQINRHRP